MLPLVQKLGVSAVTDCDASEEMVMAGFVVICVLQPLQASLPSEGVTGLGVILVSTPVRNPVALSDKSVLVPSSKV